MPLAKVWREDESVWIYFSIVAEKNKTWYAGG
jgi:hypothetical protein